MKPAPMVLGSTLVMLGFVVVLGAAAAIGEPVRRAALLSLDDEPPVESLPLSDTSPEASSFFLERDSVTLRVPWDMTVAELLTLYHLENNTSARQALRDRFGAVEAGDRLQEGSELSFVLTAREDVP